MSAIEQVIARARQGEVAFAERKQFKLARSRAIEKLRRFALADPYFYILELIQAAIAGGADYVDISCSEGDVLVSWTGGNIREAELAQLFDFLFASKQRVDLAHVRSLALGVNALLLFDPEQVVIESGDGTPGGTARMVVRAGAESVDVGRAEGALNGTYVRATRLNRDKVAEETGRRGDDDGSLEYGTVEVRCLAAPVPLVFNGQPLFGWSRQRVPNLFGYRQVRSFDEGDLYGSIGRNPSGGEASFQLMTHGVWVQSYQYELIKGQKLGGVVCFDSLRKTVDHSGFVRDDRFEELWLRLRPYAEALMGGKVASVERITSADGLEYSPNELRELLQTNPRVVITDSGDADVKHRAKVIARLLGAQVLRVPPSLANAVRVLGGREVELWRPQLRNDEELSFYGQDPLAPPAEPHLRPAVELDAPTAKELASRLAARNGGWRDVYGVLYEEDRLPLEAREAKDDEDQDEILTMLEVLLGATGTVRATLYSPVDANDAAHGLLVRVTSTGRLLERRLYASAYPGRVLDVELPTAQVSLALEHGVATKVAEYFAALAVPVLREQDQRALAGLGVGKIEPGSVAARLALEVLSRVTTTRVRAARPGRLAPGLSFSLLRPTSSGFDPFGLALLRTRSGKDLSLRELALTADACGGLAYGTIPEVPADLDGLDLDRVLDLDAGSERILIGLLGESGYVRIDARDVLAADEGVRVRDLALGLRDYPDFPLLVEGAVDQLDALDDVGRGALVASLVGRLIRRMHGGADEPGAAASELEEHRRQAVRHLQWFACRERAAGRVEGLAALGLDRLPLFLDIEGQAWSARAVFEALASNEGLLVHYGHVLGSAELGALTGASLEPSAGRPSSLAVSAFTYRLLAPLGRLRLAFDFDFDLDDVEASHNPMTAEVAFLVRESFDSGHGSGVLGIPATRLAEYRIALTGRGRGVLAAFDELAHLYGIVGMIEVEPAHWGPEAAEAIYAQLDARAGELLEQLIEQLPVLADEPRHYEAAVRVLLHYAGEQLTLIASALGLSVQVATALAERILGLPLFDTGAVTQVSAQRMLELFRRHFEPHHVAGEAIEPFDWSTIVVGRDAGGVTTDFAREWLGDHLQPARVVMPASSAGARATGGAEPSEAAEAALEPWPVDEPLPLDLLAANLEHWLAALRPDSPMLREQPVRTRVWILEHELASGGRFEGGSVRLEIEASHPLIERVAAEPSPRNFAWLLLAAYAYINEILAPVTNSHEAAFQIIVGEALVSGRLKVLAGLED